jgi:hypothetical protein
MTTAAQAALMNNPLASLPTAPGSQSSTPTIPAATLGTSSPLYALLNDTGANAGDLTALPAGTTPSLAGAISSASTHTPQTNVAIPKSGIQPAAPTVASQMQQLLAPDVSQAKALPGLFSSLMSQVDSVADQTPLNTADVPAYLTAADENAVKAASGTSGISSALTSLGSAMSEAAKNVPFTSLINALLTHQQYDIEEGTTSVSIPSNAPEYVKHIVAAINDIGSAGNANASLQNILGITSTSTKVPVSQLPTTDTQGDQPGTD